MARDGGTHPLPLHTLAAGPFDFITHLARRLVHSASSGDNVMLQGFRLTNPAADTRGKLTPLPDDATDRFKESTLPA